ncbi:hypothetical protein N0V94_005840 [Neodidymelliopsis sp. IMI 364377]|nr:hypothetical protein N0V94_005840 [Neodidymelliopsis sp. IMI 364377]
MQSFATAVPSFAASLSAYTRIQVFLTSSDRHAIGDKDACFRNNRRRSDQTPSSSTELDELKTHVKSATAPGNIIQVEAASFSFQSSTAPALENISVRVPSATLTVVTGPTGSGKSALLEALLGELICVQGRLSVETKDIGYCAQHPWVPASTIKDVILAANHYDEAWYRAVLHACVLDQDLEGFPDDDQTLVGNKGTKLSGGQKQRVVSKRYRKHHFPEG